MSRDRNGWMKQVSCDIGGSCGVDFRRRDEEDRPDNRRRFGVIRCKELCIGGEVMRRMCGSVQRVGAVLWP